MVRSLLARRRMLKSFWSKVMNWSIHILNKSLIIVVQNMTLEEAWSGRKPIVDHFRIFGCIAYAHVSDEKMMKLDNKGDKCVFLSVSEVSKAYKLFNSLTKKIVTSICHFFFMRRALGIRMGNNLLKSFFIVKLKNKDNILYTNKFQQLLYPKIHHM